MAAPTASPPPRTQENRATDRLGAKFHAALDAPRKNHSDETATAEQWAHALLDDALSARASDIHLDPREDGVRVRFRIDGALSEVALLDHAAGPRLIRYFKANSDMEPGPALLPAVSHFSHEPPLGVVDVRVACTPCLEGEKMALRLLQRSTLRFSLEDLGLGRKELEKLRDWLGDISGMVLVTGPTGSGKTTTLYALLQELKADDRSVVTVEDPVEYSLPDTVQIQVDERRGLDFPTGLRGILRLDPDYILLGEVRDAESAQVAMEAATTGHTVLTTMHSRNAAGAISMLRNFGLADHEIATATAFVIGQRLVRTLCPQCREEAAPPEDDSRWLRRMGMEVPAQTWLARGCGDCRQTGYRGRTGVFEIWPIDEESYRLILAGADEHKLRQHQQEKGIRSLIGHGLEKVGEGVTTLAELRSLGAQSYLEEEPR